MRHLRAVASVALIAVLANVGVPGPAGSRAPVPFDQPDVNLSLQVEMAAVRGMTMTTEPLDPGARSDGNLDPRSTVFEPAQRIGPPQARSGAASLPKASPESVKRNPWRYDGNVSWFGPGLYGNGTACGQKLTRGLVGVAHRTLPCGTLIEFRNPENGRVVTAAVIDRGPFVSGRKWDLSHGLCDKLNHCHTGAIEWRYAKTG